MSTSPAPLRLTCLCPASGDEITTEFSHDGGYALDNLNLPAIGGSVLHNPVSQIAKALEGDGYSAFVNFALIDSSSGRVLHCGPVNADMMKRSQAEQALRETMNTRPRLP